MRAPVPRSDVRLFVRPVWQEGHSRSYPRPPLWLRVLVFLVSLGARRPAAGAGSWDLGAVRIRPSIHHFYDQRTDSRAASGDPPGITQHTTLLSMCVLIAWMDSDVPVFGTWYLVFGAVELVVPRERSGSSEWQVNRDGVLGALVCIVYIHSTPGYGSSNTVQGSFLSSPSVAEIDRGLEAFMRSCVGAAKRSVVRLRCTVPSGSRGEPKSF